MSDAEMYVWALGMRLLFEEYVTYIDKCVGWETAEIANDLLKDFGELPFTEVVKQSDGKFKLQ
jgi:hypothetical protein